jgi:exodeoxyribonuclease V alpha subunit
MPELIRGRIIRILFNDGDYYVLNLADAEDKGKPLTARGNIYGLLQLKADITIKLFGKWAKHAKYGLQFSFKTWRPWAQTPDDVEEFLHVCVDGFSDRSVARDIAEFFGTKAFEALSKQPTPGAISDESALAWDRALALRDLTGLLSTSGLGNMEIRAIMGHFGMDAAEVIQEDPFRVMEVGTIPFGRVDQLALKLGGSLDDPRRIGGAILWMLRRQLNQGHLYHRRGDIPRLTNALLREEQLVPLTLGIEPDKTYAEVAQELVDKGSLKLDPDHGVYLPDFYTYERESAEMLAELLAPSDIDIDAEAFIKEYERINRIVLSEDQRRAVEELSRHRVLVLTGLPGGRRLVLPHGSDRDRRQAPGFCGEPPGDDDPSGPWVRRGLLGAPRGQPVRR